MQSPNKPSCSHEHLSMHKGARAHDANLPGATESLSAVPGVRTRVYHRPHHRPKFHVSTITTRASMAMPITTRNTNKDIALHAQGRPRHCQPGPHFVFRGGRVAGTVSVVDAAQGVVDSVGFMGKDCSVRTTSSLKRVLLKMKEDKPWTACSLTPHVGCLQNEVALWILSGCPIGCRCELQPSRQVSAGDNACAP